VVGIGDAAVTHLPTRAPGPAVARAERVLAQGGEPANAGPTDSQAARAAAPLPTSRVAERSEPDRTLGPLDAEKGRRSFDDERPGPASDNQMMRTASNAAHPGLTDFSRAAAPAPAEAPDGRGPGAAPGAVAHAASGTAPAAYGARDPAALGPEVSERTADRRYDRYLLEVKNKVRKTWEIPRSLVVRLEQGETVVTFVIGLDGQVGDGPRLVKSSGFPELDDSALRAVRRAAPFPPMSDRRSARPQRVTMSLGLDNPVIR
jgi:TonB family protein